MRRPLLMLLFGTILLFFGVSRVSSQEVTFSYQPFRKGDRIHTKQTMKFTMYMSRVRRDTRAFEMDYTMKGAFQEEVQSVKNGKLMNLKVTVSRASGQTNVKVGGNRNQNTLQLPIHGNSYRVSAAENGLNIRTKAGKDVLGRERSMLAKRYGKMGVNLGSKPIHVQKLQGKTFHVGDSIELTKIPFKPFEMGLARTTDSTTIEDVSYELNSVKQKEGEKIAVITGEGLITARKHQREKRTMNLSIEMNMTIFIEASTCRLTEQELEGDIEIDGTVSDRVVDRKVTGGGSVSGSLSSSYKSNTFHSSPMRYK